MRGQFETDFRYPWQVILIGDKWTPSNHHTNERLAGRPTYQEAEADLHAHLHNVRTGAPINRAAALTRSPAA